MMVIFTILALPCPNSSSGESVSQNHLMHLSLQAGGIITDGPHTCPVSDDVGEVNDRPQ